MPADGGHRVYNVATGTGTTFRELAETDRRTDQRELVRLKYVHVNREGSDLVADIDRARGELGFTACVAAARRHT